MRWRDWDGTQPWALRYKGPHSVVVRIGLRVMAHNGAALIRIRKQRRMSTAQIASKTCIFCGIVRCSTQKKYLLTESMRLLDVNA
jgi:hypothetical protein